MVRSLGMMVVFLCLGLQSDAAASAEPDKGWNEWVFCSACHYDDVADSVIPQWRSNVTKAELVEFGKLATISDVRRLFGEETGSHRPFREWTDQQIGDLLDFMAHDPRMRK